jgi:hypothetical protein
VLQRALTGANGLSAQAGAYGAAFWWTTALTAAAVVPCLVLVRAERRARAERAGAQLDDVDAAVAIAEAVA